MTTDEAVDINADPIAHKARHVQLHGALTELVAMAPEPVCANILAFLLWSARQRVSAPGTKMHAAFDELLADFIIHNPCASLKSTRVEYFVQWSAAQTQCPTIHPEYR